MLSIPQGNALDWRKLPCARRVPPAHQDAMTHATSFNVPSALVMRGTRNPNPCRMRFCVPLCVLLVTTTWAQDVYNESGSLSFFVPDDLSSDDAFGSSVDVDGDILVAGAPSANGGIGRVYINKVVRDPVLSVNAVQTLTLEDADGTPQFGQGVALSGDILIVGIPGLDSDRGAVQVFKRDDGADTFSFVQQIQGSVTQPGNRFGESLDMDGDTAVVGHATAFAALFVLVRNPGMDTFNETQILVGNGPQSDFGNKVAVCGNTIATTASEFNNDRVFTFTRPTPNGVFNLRQELQEIPFSGVQFGFSLDLSERAISITDGSSVVRVFFRDDESDAFGDEVTLSTSLALQAKLLQLPNGLQRLAIGVPSGSVGSISSGRIRILDQRTVDGQPDKSFDVIQEVSSSSASRSAGDRFGEAFAIESGILVVGVPGADTIAENTGAVDLFNEITPPTMGPSAGPTLGPTKSSAPSISASQQPSLVTSQEPSEVSSGKPSMSPSAKPSIIPSKGPTAHPTETPNNEASISPSASQAQSSPPSTIVAQAPRDDNENDDDLDSATLAAIIVPVVVGVAVVAAGAVYVLNIRQHPYEKAKEENFSERA